MTQKIVNVSEIEHAIKFTDGRSIEDRIRALLDQSPSVSGEAVEADFFQLENGSEYWYECPDDSAIISDLDDAIVGTEYSVFASHTYRQTYRITKIPDENNDDTEVVLVSSQRNYFTTPKQDRVAELEAKLKVAVDALDNIVKHFDVMGKSITEYSTTYKIATEAIAKI